MPKLSMGQAAKHASVSKTTLSRWIEKGKISAEKQEDGSYLIDPSELDRINTAKEKSNARNRHRDSHANSNMPQSGTPLSDGGLQVELEVLRQKEKLKDEKISDLKETIQDLKSERDEWRTAHQRVLLTYQPQKAPESPLEAQNRATSRDALGEPKQDIPWQRMTILTAIFMLCLVGIILLQYFQAEIKHFIDQDILGKEQHYKPASVGGLI